MSTYRQQRASEDLLVGRGAGSEAEPQGGDVWLHRARESKACMGRMYAKKTSRCHSSCRRAVRRIQMRALIGSPLLSSFTETPQAAALNLQLRRVATSRQAFWRKSGEHETVENESHKRSRGSTDTCVDAKRGFTSVSLRVNTSKEQQSTHLHPPPGVIL